MCLSSTCCSNPFARRFAFSTPPTHFLGARAVPRALASNFRAKFVREIILTVWVSMVVQTTKLSNCETFDFLAERVIILPVVLFHSPLNNNLFVGKIPPYIYCLAHKWRYVLGFRYLNEWLVCWCSIHIIIIKSIIGVVKFVLAVITWILHNLFKGEGSNAYLKLHLLCVLKVFYIATLKTEYNSYC